MMISALILLVFETGAAQAAVDPSMLEAPAVAQPQAPSIAPAPTAEVALPQQSGSVTTVVEENGVSVEKKIIYKKETTVDLTGTTVEGENQLPPAFFVTKMQTPNARSLLEERLRFGLRDYNHMGF